MPLVDMAMVAVLSSARLQVSEHKLSDLDELRSPNHCHRTLNLSPNFGSIVRAATPKLRKSQRPRAEPLPKIALRSLGVPVEARGVPGPPRHPVGWWTDCWQKTSVQGLGFRL